MSLIARERGGLVLAEEAMDEASIGRALKGLDPRLVLQKHRRDGVEGGYVYKVLRVWSDDHPATVVFTWMDETGRPLPLSSGLVDEVQRHMVGARNSGLGHEDDHNARLAAERERRQREEGRAVSDWYRPHLEQGRVTVSLANIPKKPYWQRNKKGLPR